MRLIALACVGLCVSSATASTRTEHAGDGGLVVYEHRDPQDRATIRIVDPELGFFPPTRKVRLGFDPAWSPRWSSDGRRLLVVGRFGTYVTKTGGRSGTVQHARRITRSEEESDADWSPDGTAVVVTRGRFGRPSCTDLYVKRVGGGPAMRLTMDEACERRPAWSPDGRRIAFESQGGESTEIVVLDVLRRDRTRLGRGSFPAWSPDARSLAFLASDEVRSDREITIVDAVTGAVLRSLRPDVPNDTLENGLSWSPDGSRLAFGFNDQQETKPVTHVAIVAADGTDTTRLTPANTFPDGDPDWQPVCTVYGTDRDDVLNGTPGDDLICGLRGNDRIRGLGGNDVILGGDGDDVIVGGAGADWLFGAAGDDRTYALDNLPDVVNGGPGADRAWVDEGLDATSETEQVAHRR